MKKIFKNMAWMLTATLVMAACSDSLDEGDNTGQGPLTGEGYVKVAINMPSTSGNSTRSTDNEEGGAIVDLEDGKANEYNVNNAILAFFKCDKTLNSGTPETEAAFVKAYPLSNTDLAISGSTETPQVTEQVSVITEAPKVADDEQLYVLAILNYNSSLFTIDNGTLTVSGTTVSKLSDLQKKISASITGETLTNNDFVNKFTTNPTTSKQDQFTMTNAPLSDKPGNSSETISGAKAYTLVPVTVYDTKAQAINGDVAKIYVERVVAKVTLKLGATNKVTDEDAQIKVTEADGTATQDIVEITGWCLNVTNNSTKLVRDVTGFNNSGWLATATDHKPERFAGTRGINASFGINNESSYYRIYWAQDCNYIGTGSTDVTDAANDFTTYYTNNGTVTPQAPAWNSGLATSTADNACYCLENTMDYNQQIDDRTTGVLIQTDYYTYFNGDTEAQKRSFFICGTSSTKYPEEQVGGGSTSSGTDAFVDYVMKEANKLITKTEYQFTTNELQIKTSLASGTYTNVADVFTFNATSDELTAQQAAVNTVVGGRISYYKDGENYYYSSLIRHFNDDEGVKVPAAGVTSVNDYALKHLGRYGVVRNNWYEITINSVSGPGDPTIVPPSGNPDDEAEGYINCTINVLSWAKRSQGVDL
ncbi:Mfa1 family fimbria major subunit [Bacteroides ndongoniae]|uniref:Mfa1 family fimbria major subunit n=1 Tax=Bacteroides ndongoniae TaxID=1903262 RepID=UPI0008D9C121|nr:Mfa1 family fimbria major subunit [Bacteroides ndongoniae]